MSESMIERVGAAIEQAPKVTMRVNKMCDDGLIFEIVAVELLSNSGEEITVLEALGTPGEANAAQERWQGIVTARAAVGAMRIPTVDMSFAGAEALRKATGPFPADEVWTVVCDAILSESPTPGDGR